MNPTSSTISTSGQLPNDVVPTKQPPKLPPWYLGGLASGGGNTDPVIFPQVPPAPIILPPIRNSCKRHQAPHGYKYQLSKGRCVLTRKPSRTRFGMMPIDCDYSQPDCGGYSGWGTGVIIPNVFIPPHFTPYGGGNGGGGNGSGVGGGVCNCLMGTPHVDSSGQCTCDNASGQPATIMATPIATPVSNLINQLTAVPANAVTSPLLLLTIAGVAAYFVFKK